MSELLGAYPSPPDSRDLILAEAAAPAAGYPTTFVAQPIPSHLTQIGGTCTAFSSTRVRISEEVRNEHKTLKLDAMWLYRQQKRIDGYPGEGSTVRAANTVLLKQGIPVIGAKNPVADAAGHRISAYTSVPRTESAFKACLSDARYGWFVIALPWATNWMRMTVANGAQLPERSEEHTSELQSLS
jgi:hypothetical protein